MPSHVIIAEFSDGIITADVVVLAPDVRAAPVQRGVEDLIASIESDDFFGTVESTISAYGDLVDVSPAVRVADSGASIASFAQLGEELWLLRFGGSVLRAVSP